MQVESIAEQLFFTTVRVDTVAPSAAYGSGIAFQFAQRRGANSYPLVVTNKHVVLGAREGSLTFLSRRDQLPPLDRYSNTPTLPRAAWQRPAP